MTSILEKNLSFHHLLAGLLISGIVSGIAVFAVVPNQAEAAVIRRAPNNFGLISYWSMEDGRGSTATDFSGNNLDGSLINNTDIADDWRSGKRGTALQFDQGDDHVQVSSDSLLDQSQTWSFWLNTDGNWGTDNGSSDDTSMLMSRHGSDTSESGVGIYLQPNTSDGTVGSQLKDANGTVCSLGGTDDLTDSQWHLVTITFSQSNGADATLYVDGQQADTCTNSSSWSFNNQDLLLGKSADLFWEEYDGRLDQVRIYDRKLSSSEVKDLYNSGGYAKRNATQDVIFPNKLVSHWTMDGPNISGSTVEDVSGSNDGSTVGGPITRPGILGQSLEFNPADDAVEVPSDPSLEISEEISMTAWVNMDTDNSSGRKVVEKFYGAAAEDLHYDFSIYPGQLESRIDNANATAVGGEVPLNEWHFIAMTYDKSELRVFNNGEQTGSTAYSQSIDTDTNPLLIGNNGTTDGGAGTDSSRNFDGQIDDVRIYNDGLSNDEVKRIYNATKPDTVNSSQNEKLTNGLAGMWSFDGPDLTSATATDVSGNGNDGTLLNGPRPAIGNVGQALEFDGNGDYVETDLLPSNIGVSGSSDLSITAWAKPSSFNGAGVWEFGTQSEGNEFSMRTQGSESQWRAQLWGSYDIDFTAGGNGEWIHISLVQNNGTTEVFVDGVQRKSRDQVIDLQDDDGFLIGEWSGDTFEGIIDNVRLYDRALSDSEVERLYRIGR